MKEQGLPERDPEEATLSCILDMGELLLTSGAEVMRVEDTIARLCKVYSFVQTNVFTITSSIVLTVVTSEGRTLTQTRRIKARDTDLGRVEKVNALSRRLCETPVDPECFRREIAEIRAGTVYPAWIRRLMYIIISAAFALFFGGTGEDAAAAAISGLVLFELLRLTDPLKLNGLLQCLLVSIVTGGTMAALHALGLGQNPERIILGNIMLLIPGIAFTASLRDIINGDTLSGLIGLCEAVFRALAVAIGFAVALMWTGG